MGQELRAQGGDRQGPGRGSRGHRPGRGLRPGRAEGPGRRLGGRHPAQAPDADAGGDPTPGLAAPLLLGRPRASALARRPGAATRVVAVRFSVRHRCALLRQTRHRLVQLPHPFHRNVHVRTARGGRARGHHDRPGPGRRAHRPDLRRLRGDGPDPGRPRGRRRLRQPRRSNASNGCTASPCSARSCPTTVTKPKRSRVRQGRLHDRLGPPPGHLPPGQPQPRVAAPAYRGHDYIQIKFDKATCLACPVRPQCTGGQWPRSLALLTGELHEIQQHNRLDQRTEQWQRRYAIRAGIEATLSQNVRACGLRRTRYRGLPKTHVQHVLTALACNVTRIADWIADPTHPPAGTQPLPCPLHRPQLTPAKSPTASWH
ncbi:transposase (plasmid) [Streptomyces sp. HUAS TT11]|uniref:transposase n=1 Tax=Streptomyces sp. HUAS TT11 TaxID=3447508 RepID=UPI003F656C4F